MFDPLERHEAEKVALQQQEHDKVHPHYHLGSFLEIFPPDRALPGHHALSDPDSCRCNRDEYTFIHNCGHRHVWQFCPRVGKKREEGDENSDECLDPVVSPALLDVDGPEFAAAYTRSADNANDLVKMSALGALVREAIAAIEKADHQLRPALTNFIYLAGLAHCENMKCWREMLSLARNHLDRDDFGKELRALEDYQSKGDKCMQQVFSSGNAGQFVNSLAGKRMSDRFAAAMDEQVLSHSLHTMSTFAFPEFLEMMQKLFPEASNDRGNSDVSSKSVDSKANAHWSSSCILKCQRETSVKHSERISAKVEEYKEELKDRGGEWPYTQHVTDTLRATILCETSEALLRAVQQVKMAPKLKLVRLKNKLGKCQKPYNIHINSIFQVDTVAPIIVEIQLLHADIDAVFKRSHRLYTISRSADIASLGAHAPGCEAEDDEDDSRAADKGHDAPVDSHDIEASLDERSGV